jgi:DNA polymerase-1
MYLTPTDKHWIVDIETDGLDATRVWVLCAKNAVTKEERVCETYAEINKFLEETVDCFYVFHNGISFDTPVLNRLLHARIPLRRVVDTFVLSSWYSPSIAGGHSLAVWGEKLGFPKQAHDDWDNYSAEMRERCRQDVEITWQLYTRLTKRMRDIGFTERGAELQHKGWHIIQKQRKNGFAFDYERAHKLYVELREKERQLKDAIYHRWPPELKLVRTFAKATKADGSPSVGFTRHNGLYPKLEIYEDGRYGAYD